MQSAAPTLPQSAVRMPWVDCTRRGQHVHFPARSNADKATHRAAEDARADLQPDDEGYPADEVEMLDFLVALCRVCRLS